jgi:Uma2 family endonuclease
MATATPLPISVSEYLHTSYRPDCDYVDGFIEERNAGLFTHSETLGAALYCLSSLEQAWKITALPILKIQISPTRFRIADICLVSRQAPREQIIRTPPVAVIEILSPEDRRPRYSARLDDYRRMGVKNIWVIDPASRKGFDCSRADNGGWIETMSFTAAGSAIHLDLAAIFAAIDEDHSR